MPLIDPMEAFKAGGEVGKKNRSSLTRTSEYMSDLFKERDKTENEVNKLKEVERFKSGLTSPKERSEIKKNEAMVDRYKSGKGVYTINPMTGELEEHGNVPFNAVVRNTQAMPFEKMQSMQSGDMVKANFDTMLKDMEKDPSLLYKVRTPLVQNAYPAARTTFESAVKEMLSETGGKTLTQSEQKVAKSTIPSVKDWAVSNSAGRGDEANIAARASLKIMSELRNRATARLRANDMNAAPEFTSQDIMRLRQEAANEYAQLKANGFSGLNKNQSQSQSDPMALREEAKRAIENGADANKVSMKFKNMTGEDL